MVAKILLDGEPRNWRNNNTGLGIFDYRMEFDMRHGFPLVTAKSVPYEKQCLTELIGFLRGYTSAADFRALGCTIWDLNANNEPAWLNNPARRGHDDLGRIYGAQWRDIRVEDSGSYAVKDQMWDLVNGLRNDPHGRRHVVSAWNPGELHLMALPPCHMFFQCYVSNQGHLDLKMYQRSADTFLGVPFNIASYATLLHILGAVTGLIPRRLIMDFGDAHLYTEHLMLAEEMLKRPYVNSVPELIVDVEEGDVLEGIEPSQFKLIGYEPHPAIKASMNV
jgi:thymidylate synthase